jgi:hypothetical protein
VRGSVVLPQGTGKSVRIAVFAQGDKAQQAKDAGADIVGFEDLANDIKGGKLDFDVVIASPDAMRVVGQLGQILGPRGLMPNPKVGTVTQDLAAAIRNAKAGQIQYRADKTGIQRERDLSQEGLGVEHDGRGRARGPGEFAAVMIGAPARSGAELWAAGGAPPAGCQRPWRLVKGSGIGIRDSAVRPGPVSFAFKGA